MPPLSLKFPVVLALAAALCGAGAQTPPADAAARCDQPPAAGQAAGFAMAAARNMAAVTGVIVIRDLRNWEELEGLDFFPPMSASTPGSLAATASEPRLERSFASGFFISADGYLITSAHAVRGATETWVVAAGGRRLPAAIVGQDPRTDVALLKVDIDAAPTILMGRRTPLCPGEPVAALGAPFGFERSVTSGVVSAYPRFVAGAAAMPLIQTDVAINPGSSGGPLFDAAGYVVGMNSMLYSASGIYIGVSFALPIERVLHIADGLRSHPGQSRRSLGLATQPVSAELARAFGLDSARGLLVVEVDPAGRAARAGLAPGDIVLATRGRPVGVDSDAEDFIVDSTRQAAELDVWRRRALHHVTIPPEAETPPAAPAARALGASRAEVRLGLTLAPASMTRSLPGLYVQWASGSALLAGIEPGDRIAAVNDIAVSNEQEFDAALETVRRQDVVALLVVRGNVSVYAAIRRRAY